MKVGDRVRPTKPIDGNTTVVGMWATIDSIEPYGVTLFFDESPKFAWGRDNRHWYCSKLDYDKLKFFETHKEFTDAEYEELLV